MHTHSSRRRWRLAVVVVAVVLGTALTACFPRVPVFGHGLRDPSPVGTIGHHSRWLVDATGRVVLLRGVNFVMKNAPYYPAAAGFDEDDAIWLKQNGFDAVRLGFTATGLMPRPGDIDEQLLARIGETVNMLTRHGLYVLLDLHQDGWGERANGEPLGSDGFPEWMTLTDGATNTHTGFPLYYVTNPAIQAAFQNLWRDTPGPDGVPLQTAVARMFGALAQRFGSNPRVLGYDVFNEPWPGTDWSRCATPPNGCSDLDHAYLDTLYSKVNRAVRAFDRSHIVFGEPFVLFNFGTAPTAMSLPGADRRNGMSFHMYALGTTEERAVATRAVQWSTATGGALLNTEWGATNDPASITRQATVLDDALIPWMYWSYDENIVKDLHQAPIGDNIAAAARDAIVRPRPAVVAGTPLSMQYDAAAKVFDFTWSTRRVRGGDFPPFAVTSVHLPSIHYPDGYTVTVEGARVTSRACAPTLTLVATRGARSASVHVTPGGVCHRR